MERQQISPTHLAYPKSAASSFGQITFVRSPKAYIEIPEQQLPTFRCSCSDLPGCDVLGAVSSNVRCYPNSRKVYRRPCGYFALTHFIANLRVLIDVDRLTYISTSTSTNPGP